MSEAQGYCDPAFEELRHQLEQNVNSGAELGASICVNVNGKDVVDMWAGFIDTERTQHWQKDTIVNVWSTSKTVTNLAALIAVDRGLLDVNAKVSKYWPEFGQNGKEHIEVRHILSHSSGVAAWEQPVTISDVCQFESSIARLEKQAPWWEPGTASGYHAIAQGHLVGELIRRTTGKTLKMFIAEEIAGPLGADFQLGALEKDWPRIASLVSPPPFPAQILELLANSKDSLSAKTLNGPAADAAVAHTAEWRHAEMGAVNGHGNARAIARILSTVSLGGAVDGVRLLSPETIDLIFQTQSDGTDLVLALPIKFGIGFGLPKPETVPWLPEGRRCFWGGWGGSVIIADTENKVTICYVMNKMGNGTLGNENSAQYVKTIYQALERSK